MAKYINIPFGENGSKTIVPKTTTDGSVNYTDGFGSDYSLELCSKNPQAKAIEREDINQLFYDLSSSIKQLQENGFFPWQSTKEGGYDKGATVSYNGANYMSIESANTKVPSDSSWVEINKISADYILTKLKTIDGLGSGLDADLLDGNKGSFYQDASNINAGTLSDKYLPSTINSNTTGNASTATKLATPRTIGGVSFDGSADITLPGVDTIGNQDTTGNAATATKLATPRTITLSGDQTGSVSFDGSTDITLTTKNVPANLLTELKTVDGSGSGLDADLIRGLPANFTANKGLNGYQLIPSNDSNNKDPLIIQWGYINLEDTDEKSGRFPIAFPNKCLQISGSLEDQTESFKIKAKDTQKYSAMGSWWGKTQLSWIAIGY